MAKEGGLWRRQEPFFSAGHREKIQFSSAAERLSSRDRARSERGMGVECDGQGERTEGGSGGGFDYLTRSRVSRVRGREG